MNIKGKKIKLNDFTLEYGQKAKEISVLCYFKWLKDNNLYVLCCEESNINYGVLYYGSGHIKGNTLILIGNKNPNEEMVKEVISKLNNNVDVMEGYEFLSLDGVDSIELVSQNRLELKPEILQSLCSRFIVVEEVKPEEVVAPKKKKSKLPVILLFIALVMGGVYYLFFFNNSNENKVLKSIVCTKEYSSDDFDAKVMEDNTYNFNDSDTLESVNRLTTYKFYEEDEYLEFVDKAKYYSYISTNNIGYSFDDNEYSFNVVDQENVDADYSLPTQYEEVMSYYKKNDYECIEQIEK